MSAATQLSSRLRGVTLVELLVALAIVALLTAVAWPGYGAIMHRAHRNDARLALLRIQQLQERHYATHLRYAAVLGPTADAQTLAAATRSSAGHYALSLEASADGQQFIAVASAVEDGRQSADQVCMLLSVDETGQRRSADGSGRWRSDDPERCWS
jgi:type IV pilus assembly protein PilE